MENPIRDIPLSSKGFENKFFQIPSDSSSPDLRRRKTTKYNPANSSSL